MFQEHLEDLGGQDWVIEQTDIKKQVFCHLWPLQISVAMVIKVWLPNNWNNGRYIIILLIHVAKRTLIGGKKYLHTRCIGAGFKWRKTKEKNNIKNRKLKQKINNDHFLLRFHNTAVDVGTPGALFPLPSFWSLWRLCRWFSGPWHQLE